MNRKRRFTATEMILSMTVLLIVLGTAFNIYSNGLSTYTDIQEKNVIYQSALQIEKSFVKDYTSQKSSELITTPSGIEWTVPSGTISYQTIDGKLVRTLPNSKKTLAKDMTIHHTASTPTSFTLEIRHTQSEFTHTFTIVQ